MEFFDKLALAFVLWGAPMFLIGAVKLDFVQFRPASEQASLRSTWRRVSSIGLALLVGATITGLFA